MLRTLWHIYAGYIWIDDDGDFRDSKINIEKTHDQFLEAAAIIKVFAAKSARVSWEPPRLTGEMGADVEALYRSFLELSDLISDYYYRKRIEDKENSIRNILGQTEESFDTSERRNAQQKIDELRTIIDKISSIGENHKQRIRVKLDQLQKEFDKEASDIDLIYGKIVSLGVTLGKFGEEAKPLVDRLGELARIVYRHQSVQEGLPEPEDNLPSLDTRNTKE